MAKQVFMNQFELATHWRMPLKTLRNWRYKGYGPACLKMGRQRLYRIKDIHEFEIKNDIHEYYNNGNEEIVLTES